MGRANECRRANRDYTEKWPKSWHKGSINWEAKALQTWIKRGVSDRLYYDWLDLLMTDGEKNIRVPKMYGGSNAFCKTQVSTKIKKIVEDIVKMRKDDRHLSTSDWCKLYKAVKAEIESEPANLQKIDLQNPISIRRRMVGTFHARRAAARCRSKA